MAKRKSDPLQDAVDSPATGSSQAPSVSQAHSGDSQTQAPKTTEKLEEVSFPGCCQARGCGGKLAPNTRQGAAVQAKVLDVDGWRRVQHVPVRCHRRSCNLKDKLVYHNYIAAASEDGKHQHLWVWPEGRNLQFFFVAKTWGVTVRWLRQFSRRLVHHFASFRGEAKVHFAEAKHEGKTADIPDQAHLKLFRAWIYWRLVLASVSILRHVFLSVVRQQGKVWRTVASNSVVCDNLKKQSNSS